MSDCQVLSAISTAVGAICLNQAGMEYTLAHPRVVEGIVVAAMSVEGPVIHLGQHLDELARHHPPLRPLVLNATLEQLRKVCENGAKFVPSEDARSRYLLTASDEAVEFDKPVENEALDKLLKIMTVSALLVMSLIRSSYKACCETVPWRRSSPRPEDLQCYSMPPIFLVSPCIRDTEFTCSTTLYSASCRV